MTITYGNIKLKDIFTKIKNGSLSVPSFQRGFDWSSKDVARFYNSVVHKREPFGSIVIWDDSDNSKAIPSDSKIFSQLAKEVSNTSKQYLIDGQQRVTSFTLSYLWYVKSDAKHLSKITKVQYNLSEKRFCVRDKNPDALNIPVFYFHVESESEFLEKINVYLKPFESELSREHERNLLSTFRSFQEVEAGTIIISSNDLNEVIDVFTLINTKGKRLTPFNIVHAKYISASKNSSFNLSDKYETIIGKVPNWSIPLGTMLLLHYSIMHQTISNKTILDLSDDVKKDVDFVNKELETVYKQATSELMSMGFETIDYLPTDKFLYLVANVVHKYNNKNITSSQHKIISDWFKYAVINDRYSSGAEGAKNNGFQEDLKMLLTSIENNFIDVANVKWIKKKMFTEDDVKELMYGSTSLDYKYVISKMIQNIPSISTGKKVLHKATDLKELHKHHLFARGNKYNDEEIVDSLANITPLEASDNIEIGNGNPIDYFKNIGINEKNSKKYYIPEKFDDLKIFVDERAKIIAKALNEEWE